MATKEEVADADRYARCQAGFRYDFERQERYHDEKDWPLIGLPKLYVFTPRFPVEHLWRAWPDTEGPNREGRGLPPSVGEEHMRRSEGVLKWLEEESRVAENEFRPSYEERFEDFRCGPESCPLFMDLGEGPAGAGQKGRREIGPGEKLPQGLRIFDGWHRSAWVLSQKARAKEKKRNPSEPFVESMPAVVGVRSTDEAHRIIEGGTI